MPKINTWRFREDGSIQLLEYTYTPRPVYRWEDHGPHDLMRNLCTRCGLTVIEFFNAPSGFPCDPSRLITR